MQTITTSYAGPTNTRGSRVMVKSWLKNKAFGWDYSLNSEANHKAAAEWEVKGFKLEKVSAQFYCIDWQLAKEFNAYLNQHGAAVAVVRIDGKYSDSMGAFEVVTVADSEGNQWEVGNMYDTTACFRLMGNVALLAYVNAQ